MSAKRRNKSPHWDAIKSYWGQAIPCESKQCMVCGKTDIPVKRSHILAHRDGGTFHLGNIHVLCYHHEEVSEYLAGEDYWDWFGLVRAAHGLPFNEGRAKKCADRFIPGFKT